MMHHRHFVLGVLGLIQLNKSLPTVHSFTTPTSFTLRSAIFSKLPKDENSEGNTSLQQKKEFYFTSQPNGSGIDEEPNTTAMNKSSKDEDSKWNTSLFPAKQFFPSQPNASSIENDVSKLLYVQILAAVVGVVSGLLVAAFKLSIESVRQFCFEDFTVFPSFLIPALGGIMVSFLIFTGDLAPGLRGVIKEVDNDSFSTSTGNELDWLRSFRKAVAAIFTLRTGNSLGPEVRSMWSHETFDLIRKVLKFSPERL